MQKEAIAVYYPEDPLERAIQDASQEANGEWLSAYQCKLLVKSICSLRCNDDWLDNPELLSLRTSHLFADHMANKKEVLVFVTHLLFLRDILENNEINSTLHAPVTFMALPLARFLFRDCPVHVHFNSDLLIAENRKLLHIGGFLVAPENQNVMINSDMVVDIKYTGDEQKFNYVKSVIKDIQNKTGCFSKAAARYEVNSFGEEELFVAEHVPSIPPDSTVWDKILRTMAVVSEVEPSENGLVKLEYDDGNEVHITKDDFDRRYVFSGEFHV